MLFKGKIKNYFPERGFGFIRRDDGQPDVFFHVRDSHRFHISDPEPGESVQFDIVHDRSRSKSKAVEIEPVV